MKISITFVHSSLNSRWSRTIFTFPCLSSMYQWWGRGVGHPTTPWTKFYPFLTNYPIKWTPEDILQTTVMTQCELSTDHLSTYLFLCKQLLNDPWLESSETNLSMEKFSPVAFGRNSSIKACHARVMEEYNSEELTHPINFVGQWMSSHLHNQSCLIIGKRQSLTSKSTFAI